MTISFAVSVCPSIHSYWTDFYEIHWFEDFWKSIENIQVSLKSDESNRYFSDSVIEDFWESMENIQVSLKSDESNRYFSDSVIEDFWESIENIQVSLKSDESNRYFSDSVIEDFENLWRIFKFL